MSKIERFINSPDSIEIIRDQTAAILTLEFARQHEFALSAGDADAHDYDVCVYVESSDPLQLVNVKDNPFPLVNVSVDSTERDRGSDRMSTRRMSARIVLDCYAGSNFTGAADMSAAATLKAWKLARVVRNIINAEPYAYLGLQGTVYGRDIVKYEAGAPANVQSAIRVSIVRCTLEVDYRDDVDIVSGAAFELASVTIKNDTGKILINN